MRIEGLILLPAVVEKLERKHRLEPEEGAGGFEGGPRVAFVEKGEREGEDRYAALGRTEAGRGVIVFFIHKLTKEALVVTAREMTHKEHRWYGKH